MKRNMKLTKKDADIVALKNFLPERKFNETVIKILRAAVKDNVAERKWARKRSLYSSS